MRMRQAKQTFMRPREATKNEMSMSTLQIGLINCKVYFLLYFGL